MKTENEVFLRQKSFTEPEARTQLLSNLEEIQRMELLTNNLLAFPTLRMPKNKIILIKY